MPVGKFAFLRYLNLEVLEGKTDCHHKLPPLPHLRGRGGISKETILYDYMKVKRRWIFLMTAMTLIAIAGVFAGEPRLVGNLCCRCGVAHHSHYFRIDDDPRTVVLLRRNGGSQERDFYHAAVVYRHGTDISALGGYRFLVMFWRRHRWHHRQPHDIPDVPQRRRCCIYHARRKHIRWCLHTVGTVRIVPDEVCHHHAIVDYGFVCRACKVLGLYVLYDVLLLCHLLPTGPHDVAS